MNKFIPLRDNHGRYESRSKFLLKALGVLVVLSAFVFTVTELAVVANDWSAKHIIRFPIEVKVNTMSVVTDREPEKVLSPIVKEIMVENTPVSNLTPNEQILLDTFGADEYRVVHAVVKCESGFNENAVNWDTRDIGLMQINWPIWEKPVMNKFGYTLKDMFDPKKNAEVGLWIWDRGDGIEGNGKGNYKAWVATTTPCFMGEL